MSSFVRSLGLAMIISALLAAPLAAAPAGRPGGSEPPPGLGVQANKNKAISNHQLGASGKVAPSKARAGAVGQAKSGAQTRTRSEMTHRVGKQR